MPQNYKKITDFFFELGMLKREKHSGFALAGINDINSLNDHSVRAAVIGYILADLEKANPEKTMLMCLIHDFPETRTRDHHKVSSRYFSTKPAEKKVFSEQIKSLPEKTRNAWQRTYREKSKRNTREGIVAQDADWLEVALSAREYVVLGYKPAQVWINNVRKALETKSAKQLLKVIEKSQPSDWWQGLKKMTYRKLKK
ncbi:MAG: HD domain-containing protein [Patescibacteria group bacterium]